MGAQRSGQEILQQVYTSVLRNYAGQEISYKDNPPTVLFKEIDEGHSTRQGYLLYEQVCAVKMNEQVWILALSTRRRGYLADEITADLKVVPPDKLNDGMPFDEAIRIAISQTARWDTHSILTANRDGTLTVRHKSEKLGLKKLVHRQKITCSDVVLHEYEAAQR